MNKFFYKKIPVGNINFEHVFAIIMSFALALIYVYMELFAFLAENDLGLGQVSYISFIGELILFLLVCFFIFLAYKFCIILWGKKYRLLTILYSLLFLFPLTIVHLIFLSFILQWGIHFFGIESGINASGWYYIFLSKCFLTIFVANYCNFVLWCLSLVFNCFFKKENLVVNKHSFIRPIKKIFIFILLSLLIYVLQYMNKDDIPAITSINAIFIFLCSPEDIINIFSNKYPVDKNKIDANFSKSILKLKLIAYEINLSWIFSLTFLGDGDSAKLKDFLSIHNSINVKYFSFLDLAGNNLKIYTFLVPLWLMLMVTMIIWKSKKVTSFFDKYVLK